MVSVKNRFIIIVVDSRLLITLGVLNNIKALLILLFGSFWPAIRASKDGWFDMSEASYCCNLGLQQRAVILS